MGKALHFAAWLVFTVIPAVAANLHSGPRLRLAIGTIRSLTATPGSISFTATNPDSGVVNGSSPAVVNWRIRQGSNLQTWTASVQASATTFTGCSTVPTSAVRVSCTGVTVSGGNGTGVCTGGTFTLSTVAQQVAAGREGTNNRTYSVSLTYSLLESWRYIAKSSCTLTLIYTIIAP